MYNMYSTEEYLTWFDSLSEYDKKEVYFNILLLEEFGPNFVRPHSDTKNGAKTKNQKELKVKTNTQLFRITFYFDIKKNKKYDILITGEGKKGKNVKILSRDLIKTNLKLRDLYKATWAMEKRMSSKSVECTHKKAELEMFAIKLGILKEKLELKQNKIKNFELSPISILKRRKDIDISKLVDYLHSLDIGLEIIIFPKNEKIEIYEEVLLRY